MADFLDDIRRHNVKVETLTREVFVNTASAALESIRDGSVITGSPGQPVADVNGGNLRGSWQLEFPTPDTALISTNSAYAPSNEDGIARPSGGVYRLLASIGGRFSVRLTILGIQAIVENETRKLIGRAA